MCIRDRISSKHAEIHLSEDGVLTLIDKDSTNGTYVNNKHITRAVIGVNDTINIGHQVLKVEAEEPVAEPLEDAAKVTSAQAHSPDASSAVEVADSQKSVPAGQAAPVDEQAAAEEAFAQPAQALVEQSLDAEAEAEAEADAEAEVDLSDSSAAQMFSDIDASQADLGGLQASLSELDRSLLHAIEPESSPSSLDDQSNEPLAQHRALPSAFDQLEAVEINASSPPANTIAAEPPKTPSTAAQAQPTDQDLSSPPSPANSISPNTQPADSASHIVGPSHINSPYLAVLSGQRWTAQKPISSYKPPQASTPVKQEVVTPPPANDNLRPERRVPLSMLRRVLSSIQQPSDKHSLQRILEQEHPGQPAAQAAETLNDNALFDQSLLDDASRPQPSSSASETVLDESIDSLAFAAEAERSQQAMNESHNPVEAEHAADDRPWLQPSRPNAELNTTDANLEASRAEASVSSAHTDNADDASADWSQAESSHAPDESSAVATVTPLRPTRVVSPSPLDVAEPLALSEAAIPQAEPVQLPAELKASLSVKSGSRAGQVLDISRPVMTLGLASQQIVAISRRADGYYLLHVETVEGQAKARVNQVALDEAHPSQRLQSGDWLEIAGVELQFSLTHPAMPEMSTG